MAEYTPVFQPADSFTLKASAAIGAGQVVAVSGSGTVAPAAAASASVVGVAAFDAAVNDSVTVFTDAVHNLTASGAVAAGDSVVAGANGTVATSATPPASELLGVALSSAIDGAKVRVLWLRS